MLKEKITLNPEIEGDKLIVKFTAVSIKYYEAGTPEDNKNEDFCVSVLLNELKPILESGFVNKEFIVHEIFDAILNESLGALINNQLMEVRDSFMSVEDPLFEQITGRILMEHTFKHRLADAYFTKESQDKVKEVIKNYLDDLKIEKEEK